MADTIWAWFTYFCHVLSPAVILGALAGYFPQIAAAVALLWYSIQIYESRTVQHWIQNARLRHRARTLIKLRAREKIVVAKIEALEKVRVAKVEARELVASAAVDAKKDIAHTPVVTAEKLPPI